MAMKLWVVAIKKFCSFCKSQGQGSSGQEIPMTLSSGRSHKEVDFPSKDLEINVRSKVNRILNQEFQTKGQMLFGKYPHLKKIHLWLTFIWA